MGPCAPKPELPPGCGIVDTERIKLIEAQIAELKGRWPAHSVPAYFFRELEDLEEKLEKARRGED